MKYLPFAAILLILAGCTKGHDRTPNPNQVGGYFAFSEKGVITTFFPHSITETTSSKIIDQVYDGLVMTDPLTMEVKPCIAKSWKVSADGLEYRFNLRNDIYFHDDNCFDGRVGRKVNAQDFVFSFSLLSTPEENNRSFSAFVDVVKGAQEYYSKGGLAVKENNLQGVIAENDSTLVIKLLKPSGVFLYTLASPVASVIPKEGFTKYGYRNSVGSGPFCIGNYDENLNLIQLKRFPYYFLKDMQGNYLPFADSVTIYLATPLSKSFKMLNEGKIHFIQNVPGSELAGFLEKNISKFQSDKPEFIAQVSAVLPEWQDIISSKLVNYKSNNISMLPLPQMYLKK